jgi:DNA-binding NtrC family response regulator
MSLKILICLEDAATSDIVDTALRQFDDLVGHAVPADRLANLAASGEFAAVFIDLERRHEKNGDLAREVRAASPDIELLCLVDRERRERYNRAKLEIKIFSFIPVPLDPFDLVRRIQRLRTSLVGETPV